jgi:hypothetical protein
VAGNAAAADSQAAAAVKAEEAEEGRAYPADALGGEEAPAAAMAAKMRAAARASAGEAPRLLPLPSGWWLPASLLGALTMVHTRARCALLLHAVPARCCVLCW